MSVNAVESNTFTRVQNKSQKSKPNKKLRVKKLREKKESYTKIPFENILISGDSHARYIAGMVKEKLHPRVNVSGMCKPGAGLLSVSPTSTISLNHHCHVLIAGTNDVAAGRGDLIYKNIENTIKQLTVGSKLVLSNIPHRYDLPLNSGVNRNIRQINSYISELCIRYEGVELMDFSGIRRSGFTSHGMHLNMTGKKTLARLITEKMSAFAVSAPSKKSIGVPPQTTASPATVMTETRQTMGTLQLDSYADVTKQHPTSRTRQRKIVNNIVNDKSNFLEPKPLIPSLG